jgi:hypothetical protein
VNETETETETFENAAIFATKRIPPLQPLLAALAPDAQISESEEADITLFFCEWHHVIIQLTIDPNWDRVAQCAGMKGWISQLAGHHDPAAVKALVRKVDSTVDCIGSVILPGYDSSGKAATLILALATALDGYIFTHQSLYDVRGVKIIGDENAPMSLKES